MRESQKLSPKYWICHNCKSDDVFLESASKDRRDCVKYFEDHYGEDWFLDDDFQINLFSIEKAQYIEHQEEYTMLYERTLESELNMSVNFNLVPNNAVQVGECLITALKELCDKEDSALDPNDGLGVLSDFMGSVMDNEVCYIWLDE